MDSMPEAQTDDQPFVEPKGYDPSLTERLSSNFGESTSGSVRGSLVTAAQAAGKAFGGTEEDRAYAKANLQNRALDKAVYDAMSWSNSPLEFGAAAAGQIGGALTSPESYINTLPGLGRMSGTAVGRIASFGLSQGVVNAGQDAIQQAVELSAGLRKSYDLAQTGLSFGLGLGLGTSFGGVGEIAARYMQFRRGGAGRPAAEPLKPDAEIAREDLSRAASEDPSMRGAAEPAPIAREESAVPAEAVPPAVEHPQVETARPPEDIARERAPDLFSKVDDLESRIDQARNALRENLKQQEAAPPDLAVSRLRSLEDDLSGFTGKRRSSPRAKAIRDEIAGLRESLGTVQGSTAARLASDETLIRLNLNDLQQQRAALGPEVRAALDEAKVNPGEKTRASTSEVAAPADVQQPARGVPEAPRRNPDTLRADPAGGKKVEEGVAPKRRLREVVQTEPVSEEARVLVMPEDAKTEPRAIVRMALEKHPPTVYDLEQAVVAAANARAPEGMRITHGSAQEIVDALHDVLAPASEARPQKATGELQFRRQTGADKKPPAGESAAAGDAAPAEVLSLQSQTLKLAEDLDLPMFQGRVDGGKAALGQFDTRQGVARVAAIADFGTAAHEAGHAIEQKVGKPLADLIQASRAELGRLDYDQTRLDPREGFAMWVEHWLTNPAFAEKEAPKFTTDFQTFLAATKPDMLKSLTEAQAAHRAWVNAPSGEKVAAIVKTQEPETVLRQIKEEGMAQTVSLAVSKSYDALLDDKSAVTKAVRDLARMARDATGVRMKLEGADNPENLVRLFARNAQAAVRDMLDGVRGYRSITPEGPGLRDAIIAATGQSGKLGFWNTAKTKEFSDYLVLRRAAALYDKFERGDLANRPLAMSKADVLQGIAEAEAKNANLSVGAQMVHDYTRALLKKMFDGGLIDADLFTKLMGEEFYVPFYRDMRDKPMAGTAGGGASPDGPGMTEVVKRMRGSDRDIIDPLQSLMTQTFLVNRTLQHNDIIKSFVALARSAQALGAKGTGRVLEEIPAHQVVGKKFDLAEAVASAARQHGIDETDTKVLLGGIADVFGEDPIMATVFRREPTGKKGEPIVFYKDGGELKAVRFVSRDEGIALYETLSQLPPVAHDWALSIGQASASALRMGIVTNPVFAVTNFVRDQLAVSILRPDYIPFNPRGLAAEVRQTPIAQLYTYAGGVSPGAGAQGLEDLVEKSIDALARKGWVTQKLGGIGELVHGHGIKRITGPAKALGEVVEVAEAGTRLNVMRTVFEQKKAQGLSDYDAMIEAAAQATDLLDFGRHGSGTLYIRTLVPFLNAHIQGLDKARRTMIEPLTRAAMGDMVTEGDVAALKNAGLSLFKLAGVGGALGVMYSLWAQNHRAYQDANADLRATHLIIPGSAFGFDGKILVIPKPFELSIGFNLGEMLGLSIKAQDPRAAEMALAGAMEVIAPPNVLSSIPIVKLYSELALNRSFFTGRDIVPERLQALKPQEQFTEKTSALARSVGTALGVSPVKVDYAIGSAFGLYGRDLLALSNTADPNAPAPSLYDQMFVRRFIKNADSASETTKRFWDQAAQRNGQLAKAKQSYENMLGQFRDADAIQFIGALPRLEKAFVVLNSSVNEDGKPAFTPDEKRLHPMARAALASITLNGMVRELARNAQNAYEDGSRIDMDPVKRRDVIEQIRVLAAMEQYNALVIAKDAGYENRKLEDTGKQLEVIKAHDMKAGLEVATRYATAKIPPIAVVAKVWPEMERRLLAEGGKADLSDLSVEMGASGYEFGAERVKKPAKRRIEIAPSMLKAQ